MKGEMGNRAIAWIAIAVMGSLAGSLAGCASTKGPMVVDTFCTTAEDMRGTWSVLDTPQTIQERVAAGNAIDKRCGKKRSHQ